MKWKSNRVRDPCLQRKLSLQELEVKHLQEYPDYSSTRERIGISFAEFSSPADVAVKDSILSAV